MNIKTWLENSIKILSPQSGTARLDAEVILAHVLKKDKYWLHAHTEQTIDKNTLEILGALIDRRFRHEPLAYILENIEFYGRDFYIKNGVLIPRPESETMIDLFKHYVADKNDKDVLLVDVGTGSGALVISAMLETKMSEAFAIDIDDNCLNVAEKNITKYGLNVRLVKGDLLKPLMKQNTESNHLIIMANLPYVPEKYSINTEAQNEPSHAIFGGKDGLDLYRKMFEQIENITAKSIAVLTESLPFQHQDLNNIATGHSFILDKEDDFIQLFVR